MTKRFVLQSRNQSDVNARRVMVYDLREGETFGDIVHSASKTIRGEHRSALINRSKLGFGVCVWSVIEGPNITHYALSQYVKLEA